MGQTPLPTSGLDGPDPRPRLSFLTTAYMTEAYLPATIESVLAQTSDDWEMVVVDNGESDAIAAIVESYAHDPRVCLLRQQNRGYTGGVMAAADAARGDYLCVLDSDDQLEPTFVGRISAFLDAHPGTDAVGCDAHLFRDGDEARFGRGYLHSTGTPPPSVDGDRLTVTAVLGGRVPYYTGAVSREAWASVGGYEPGESGIDESVLIWLRLASQFNVLLIPDRLARYRVRDASLSRHPDKVEDFESALIRTFKDFAERSGSSEHLAAAEVTARRLQYHQALRRARSAFILGDDRTARRHAVDAFRHRHTPRAAAAVLAATLLPRLVRRLYPVRQQLREVVRRALPLTRR